MYVYDFELQSSLTGNVIHMENLSLHDFRENLIWLCNLCGVDQPWMNRKIVCIEALRRYMRNNPVFTYFVSYRKWVNVNYV